MQCETWWEEEGGGGWPFYPTGGGGGGGYPPAPPPCTTNFTNNFSIPGTNNVVPINPCPPINNSWPPVPPPPPFCDPFVDALSANTNFVNVFHWLNTSGPNQPLGLNYEVGVEIRDVNQYNNSNYITKYGAPDTKTVDFYLQANTLQAGFLHSHYSGLNSMFTADDIILLATTFMTNHAKDTNNLFMGLTSSYSTPFIMKVGNVAKFRQFCTKIVGANGLDSLKKEDFKDKYDRKVDSYDPDANEKAFLEMFKEYGGEDGLNLLSGNIACNQWTKRRIDNFGAVKNVPSCN